MPQSCAPLSSSAKPVAAGACGRSDTGAYGGRSKKKKEESRNNYGSKGVTRHVCATLSYLLPLLIPLTLSVVFLLPLDFHVLYEPPTLHPLEKLKANDKLPSGEPLCSAENCDAFKIGPPGLLENGGGWRKELTRKGIEGKAKKTHCAADRLFCYFEDTDARATVQNKERHSYVRRTFYYFYQGNTTEDSEHRKSVDPVWLQSWVYIPEHTQEPLPLVLMASGLGAQKDTGLEPFAEQFVESGALCVMAFDYRTWGGSGGFPRHLLIPAEAVADYTNTLRLLVDTNGLGISAIDSSRIILWGTSYSGGHVIAAVHDLRQQDNERDKKEDVNDDRTGARCDIMENEGVYLKSIRGVISMVPFLDGKDAFVTSLRKCGVWTSLRLANALLADSVRGYLCQKLQYDRRTRISAQEPPINPSPSSIADALFSQLCSAVYVQIASPMAGFTSSRLGAMTLSPADYGIWKAKLLPGFRCSCCSPEAKRDGKAAEQEVSSVHNAAVPCSQCAGCTSHLLGGWRNAIVARSAAFVASYRPITLLQSLESIPILFIAAGNDSVVSPALARLAAKQVNSWPKDKIAASSCPIPKASLLDVEASHFDVYFEPHRSVIVERMIQFSRELLSSSNSR